MLFRHADATLQRLDDEADFTGGYSRAIVKAYRSRMQLIRAAADIRTFYGLKSLHFEKLKGKRQRQHSMRLNKQFRLVVEIEKDSAGAQTLVIVSIEDYH